MGEEVLGEGASGPTPASYLHRATSEATVTPTTPRLWGWLCDP